MTKVTARVNVICQHCGYRQLLERNSFAPVERIVMICHGCEERIEAEFRKPVDSPLEPEYSLARNPWFGQLFGGIQ